VRVGGFQIPGVCQQAFPSFLPLPLPVLLLAPFSRCNSLLLNLTETLATQAKVEHIEKFSLTFSNYFVIGNLCPSSPSLAILVPLWSVIISLMFFYLIKLVFSGFLPFKGYFVWGQNNSKYRH